MHQYTLPTIEPLSLKTLRPAIALLKREFPKQPLLERVDLALLASLLPRWARIGLQILQIVSLRYWVAVQDGRVVGVTGLYSYGQEPGICWLGWTCVAPSCRRRGLGRSLVQWAIEQAGQSGKQSLRLYTHIDLKEAEPFYRSLGFRPLALQPKRKGQVFMQIDVSRF